MKHKIRKFSKKIKQGLHQEYQETKDIPKHIKNKEYKKAFQQLGDIIKMSILSLLWILPGGGIVSGALLKIFKKMRPSAFQEKKEDS